MSISAAFDVFPRERSGTSVARSLRRENLVPGVVYGGGGDVTLVSIKQNELVKVISKGRFLSKLFSLNLEGKSVRVVVKELQKHPLKGHPIHVDFMRLTESSRVTLNIPVEFVNRDDSPGLKSGGVLNVVLHEMELSVIAGDIPERITVDLTGKNFGDVIHLSSVNLPSGAVPVGKEDDVTIATITVASSLNLSSSQDEEEVEGEGSDKE